MVTHLRHFFRHFLHGLLYLRNFYQRLHSSHHFCALLKCSCNSQGGYKTKVCKLNIMPKDKKQFVKHKHIEFSKQVQICSQMSNMLRNAKYANKCQICSQMSNMLTNVKFPHKCQIC